MRINKSIRRFLLYTVLLFFYLGCPKVASANSLSWTQIYNYPGASGSVQFSSSGEIVFASVSNNGGFDLLKSSDAGQTWSSVKSNLPPGSDINWISIFKQNPSIVAVSLWQSGIFLTENSGISWMKIFDSQSPRSVSIDPNNYNKLLAGIGGNNSGQSGVFISTDKGQSWTKETSLGDRNNAQISIDPDNSNRIFADADPNFYRSLDGGLSWAQLPLFSAYSTGTIFDKNNPNTVITAKYDSNHGIYKSTDGGGIWQLLSNAPNGIVYHLARDNVSNYIFGSVVGSPWGIWESVDNGDNWENVSDPTWGNRNVWGFDTKNGSIIVSVQGLGLFYSKYYSPPALNPVVIVPGFGTSWSYKGLIENKPTTSSDWQLLPFFIDQAYRPLITALQQNGLVENKNQFVFSYDFRKSVIDNAILLNQFVNETVVPLNPGVKINLIAHSMGGLIVRECIEKVLGCSDVVNKVVNGGTPQNGLLKAYKLWEGGVVDEEDPLVRTIEEAALRSFNTQYSNIKDIVQNKFPGVRDLLPIFNYINGRPYDQMSSTARNTVLEQLWPPSSNFAHSLFAMSADSIPTDSLFYVKVPNKNERKLGLWIDGKPTGADKSQGDGTVLKSSSEMLSAQNSYFQFKHSDYFKTLSSINATLDYLGLNQVTNITLSQEIKSILSIVIHSPATIVVKDSNGNIVGYSDQGKAVFVPNPQLGGYKIEVTGMGVGSIVLDTVYADSIGTSHDSIFELVFPGSHSVKLIKLVKDGAATKVFASNDDNYRSFISCLNFFSQRESGKIIQKTNLAFSGNVPQSLIDKDTEGSRYDDDRDDLRFSMFLSAYRDTIKLLANENDQYKRSRLLDSEIDIRNLIAQSTGTTSISSPKIYLRILSLQKKIDSISLSGNLSSLEGLNLLVAQDFLNQSSEFLQNGDKIDAYLLTLAAEILIK